jgi:hypothetical protein
MYKVLEETLIIILLLLSPLYQFIYIYTRYSENILNKTTILINICTNILSILYNTYIINYQLTKTDDFILLNGNVYTYFISTYIMIISLITFINIILCHKLS